MGPSGSGLRRRSGVIVSIFEYTRHCVDSGSNADRTLYRLAAHLMLAQSALV